MLKVSLQLLQCIKDLFMIRTREASLIAIVKPFISLRQGFGVRLSKRRWYLIRLYVFNCFCRMYGAVTGRRLFESGVL